jgi:hypothetical protein
MAAEDDDPDTDRLEQLLGPLAAIQTQVARIQAVDPAPIVQLLQAAHEAVTAAEGVLPRHQHAPAAVAPWFHELRGAINGMVGWAAVFVAKPDVEMRDRAAAKMRECARQLARLLTRAP